MKTLFTILILGIFLIPISATQNTLKSILGTWKDVSEVWEEEKGPILRFNNNGIMEKHIIGDPFNADPELQKNQRQTYYYKVSGNYLFTTAQLDRVNKQVQAQYLNFLRSARLGKTHKRIITYKIELVSDEELVLDVVNCYGTPVACTSWGITSNFKKTESRFKPGE